jgi:hypothetical protein
MFNKAALAAYIVVKCHSPQYPFGRVKLAKLFYLAQRRAEMTLTESFSRRAAGPLDDSIHKFLSLANKQGWVKLLPAQGRLKPVAPGDDPQPAMDKVHQRWSAAIGVLDDMLETMKKWRTETLERWATVEPVAEELAAQGQPVTATTVLAALANIPEWKSKLDRESFSEDKIAATIEGLRKFGFLPQGS